MEFAFYAVFVAGLVIAAGYIGFAAGESTGYRKGYEICRNRYRDLMTKKGQLVVECSCKDRGD